VRKMAPRASGMAFGYVCIGLRAVYELEKDGSTVIMA
jgi:hypothetical protein